MPIILLIQNLALSIRLVIDLLKSKAATFDPFFI
jgi:hypothetical protein